MAYKTEIIKLYKENRKAPVSLKEIHSPTRSAVNSVAIITGKSWEDTVKSLIEQAHYRASIPSYKTCITDLFRKSGFVPVHYEGKISRFLEECNNAPYSGTKYIIKTHDGYFASRPDTVQKKYSLEGIWPKTCVIYDYRIIELWQYIPGTDNRTGIKRCSTRQRFIDGDKSFEFENMNPENKYTDDCSIRGLSAAYGCTWHEAVDLLANTLKFSDPVINTRRNINFTLIDLGFERCQPIKRANKLLNGKEFCQLMDHTFQNGERIFAYVGKNHCAAVLPIKQQDGSVKYKIQDTWDSTSRFIGEWYVYKQPKPLMPKIKTCDAVFELGNTVCHPLFGKGEIISVSGKGDTRILEVKFNTVGIKKISESWLKKEGKHT